MFPAYRSFFDQMLWKSFNYISLFSSHNLINLIAFIHIKQFDLRIFQMIFAVLLVA